MTEEYSEYKKTDEYRKRLFDIFENKLNAVCPLIGKKCLNESCEWWNCESCLITSIDSKLSDLIEILNK